MPCHSLFCGYIHFTSLFIDLELPTCRLASLEVANEKLGSVNKISEGNYFKMSVELRQSTRTLVNMKRELDSVFRRIRCLII